MPGIGKYLYLVLPAFLCLAPMQLWATHFALPPKYRAEQLSLTVDGTYFTTSANYSEEGGTIEKLDNGKDYQNFSTNFVGHYAVDRRWAVFGSLGLAYAQSSNTDYVRDNSQLTEIQLGTQYKFPQRLWSFWPEAFVIIPLNTFSESTDDVLTGEGAYGLQTGAWAMTRLWGFFPYAYLGFRFQAEGRAGLIPFRFGAYKTMRSGWMFGGSIEGVTTLIDDKYTSKPLERNRVTSRVNGGSFRYYSVNPELIEVRGWAGLRLNPAIDLRIGIGQTINGTSSAAGTSILASLFWRMSTKDESPSAKKINRRKKAVEQFKIDAPEDYDPGLFKSEDEAESESGSEN